MGRSCPLMRCPRSGHPPSARDDTIRGRGSRCNRSRHRLDEDSIESGALDRLGSYPQPPGASIATLVDDHTPAKERWQGFAQCCAPDVRRVQCLAHRNVCLRDVRCSDYNEEGPFREVYLDKRAPDSFMMALPPRQSGGHMDLRAEQRRGRKEPPPRQPAERTEVISLPGPEKSTQLVSGPQPFDCQ